MSKDDQRLISREVITHVSKGVIADQFYAERLYSRESLRELLVDTGFSDIEFRSDIVTDSQRNQDLGMMERRIVATCAARKQWTRKPQETKAIPTIAVILGDHRKSDRIKPNENFDADDFFTIDEFAVFDILGWVWSTPGRVEGRKIVLKDYLGSQAHVRDNQYHCQCQTQNRHF